MDSDQARLFWAILDRETLMKDDDKTKDDRTPMLYGTRELKTAGWIGGCDLRFAICDEERR